MRPRHNSGRLKIKAVKDGEKIGQGCHHSTHQGSGATRGHKVEALVGPSRAISRLPRVTAQAPGSCDNNVTFLDQAPLQHDRC